MKFIDIGAGRFYNSDLEENYFQAAVERIKNDFA